MNILEYGNTVLENQKEDIQRIPSHYFVTLVIYIYFNIIEYLWNTF